MNFDTDLMFGAGRDDCDRRDRDGCRAVVTKNVGVRTPVAVDVDASHGPVRVVCGRPHITGHPPYSEGGSTRCEFTINQKIRVEIPIRYRVHTDVRDSFVDCDADGDDM